MRQKGGEKRKGKSAWLWVPSQMRRRKESTPKNRDRDEIKRSVKQVSINPSRTEEKKKKSGRAMRKKGTTRA